MAKVGNIEIELKLKPLEPGAAKALRRAVRDSLVPALARYRGDVVRSAVTAPPEIDPGPGYRLLADYETVRTEDEILVSGRWGRWHCEPVINNTIGNEARRKIRQQSPEWRWVDEEEKLDAKDEWLSVTGTWKPTRHAGELPDGESYRRRTAEAPGTFGTETDPGIGYRLLAAGETARELDECRLIAAGRWAQMSGTPFRVECENRVRRKIRRQSPGWRYMDKGEQKTDPDQFDGLDGWVDTVESASEIPVRNATDYRRRICPDKHEMDERCICVRCGVTDETLAYDEIMDDVKRGAEEMAKENGLSPERDELQRIAKERLERFRTTVVKEAHEVSVGDARPDYLIAPSGHLACGCGYHSVDPKQDLYFQHNNWMGSGSPEWLLNYSKATLEAKGIGVSDRPEPARIIVDMQHEDGEGL